MTALLGGFLATSKHRYVVVDVLVWVIFCLADGIIWLGKEVTLTQTLGAMVSSSVQNLTEGVRYVVMILGSCLGLMLAGFVLPYLLEVGCVYVAVLVVVLIVLDGRHASLINPRCLVSCED